MVPPGRNGCALVSVAECVTESPTFGRRRWAVPEGYIPGRSVDSTDRDLVSHEAICMMNFSGEDAQVALTVFFVDRDPVGPFRISLPARRTRHLRLNDLRDPETLPRDTPFSTLVESDIPIVVQYTRLDSRDPNIALLSTIAFALD